MSRSRIVGASIALLLVGATLALVFRADSGESVPKAAPVGRPMKAAASTVAPPEIVQGEAIDLGALPSTEWVNLYDPQRSWNGYTLMFYERRIPMVVDMNGRIVHSWPTIRAVSRARLTERGTLIYISVDDQLVEVDWDGTPIRTMSSGNVHSFPHHDLQETAQNGLIGIFREGQKTTDNLLAFDESGTIVWTWKSADHLTEDLKGEHDNDRDLTHFNSVQEIPENPHARAGDLRFAPGNVLFSSRHLSSVYLVDRTTGEVVWTYTDGLDWQHEPILLGDDVPGAGNVLLFNNRYHSADRRSEVLEIDPTTNKVVWRYSDAWFFSDTGGTAQKLPNGNVHITSGSGGRAFEVTPEGEIVWQWAPPFHPMRTLRYAPDHCPQLAALTPQPSLPVPATDASRHIDQTLYTFSLSKEIVKAKIDGKKRRLLRKANDCKELRLPARPNLVLDYGFLNALPNGPTDLSGHLTVTLQTEEASEPVTIFDTEAKLSVDGVWTRERVRLDPRWALSTVRMCIQSTAPDLSRDEVLHHSGFVVQSPKIASASSPSRRGLPRVQRGKEHEPADGRSLQQRQLEELGYIE